MSGSQTTPPRRIRGIRDTIPNGYVLGRASSGNGKAELIPFAKLGTHLVSAGTVSPPIPATPSSSAGGLFGPILKTPVPTQTNTGLNTWANQGGATETDSLMGMSFAMPSNGSAHLTRGLFKAAPATPYTATMLILPNALNLPTGVYFLTIGWMDSVSGKLLTTLIGDGQFDWGNWTNTGTLSAFTSVFGANTPNWIWLQLKDDGTTATINLSNDGITFYPYIATTKAGSFLGATGYNRIFVGHDAFNSLSGLTLASYTD